MKKRWRTDKSNPMYATFPTEQSEYERLRDFEFDEKITKPFDKLTKLYKEFLLQNKMYGFYWGNRKYIQQQVDNMSRQYNVDLVIYDETEHF